MASAVVCSCGCNKKFHLSHLTLVEVERALDPEGRRTRRKSFLVAREHKEPFERELALMTQLAALVRAYVNASWCARVRRARDIVRIQHAIYERNEGFDGASKRAKRTGFLFASPKPLQPFILRYYERKDLRHAARP